MVEELKDKYSLFLRLYYCWQNKENTYKEFQDDVKKYHLEDAIKLFKQKRLKRESTGDCRSAYEIMLEVPTIFEHYILLTLEEKEKFINELGKSLDLQDNGQYRCPCGKECCYLLTFSKTILDQLGFSVEKVANIIGFFQENGGYCDCEVMMNVICREENFDKFV